MTAKDPQPENGMAGIAPSSKSMSSGAMERAPQTAVVTLGGSQELSIVPFQHPQWLLELEGSSESSSFNPILQMGKLRPKVGRGLAHGHTACLFLLFGNGKMSPCPCPHHIPKKGLNYLAQVASCAVCLLPPAPPTPHPQVPFLRKDREDAAGICRSLLEIRRSRMGERPSDMQGARDGAE